MRRLKVNFENRCLYMKGPKRKEALSIASPYPWDDFSERLFAALGTMHLVAPYLPRVIKTNFDMPAPIRDLITGMYESEDRPAPSVGPLCSSRFSLRKPDPGRVAIAYSAGKDSMWNLWWAIEKYGADNVLVTHIRGLNRNNGSDESRYVLRQQKQLGFRHLEIIDLRNGSLNTGFQTMRSRDMFLAGLIVPVALKFGASKIITEGFYGAQADEPYFTGIETNMRYFNRILKNLGVPAQMVWRNRDEMYTIRDLFENRPEWMPHVCNCFTIPCYKGVQRRAWQVRTPTFPLYESQCGVCVKCKIVNLARVLYDPASARIAPEDIRSFLALTDKWLRDPKRTSADMTEGPFMRDFAKACRLYGIHAKSLSS